MSGSEVTCEVEFTIPEDDRFFDDKVRCPDRYSYEVGVFTGARIDECALLLRCRALTKASPSSEDCCVFPARALYEYV